MPSYVCAQAVKQIMGILLTSAWDRFSVLMSTDTSEHRAADPASQWSAILGAREDTESFLVTYVHFLTEGIVYSDNEKVVLLSHFKDGVNQQRAARAREY